MATERQTTANKANARNATGPRSRAGRKRSSRNARRHGLGARPIANADLAKAIEQLARKLAEPTPGVIALEHARTAAYAVFLLARIRQLKVELIEEQLACPDPDADPASSLVASEPAAAQSDSAQLDAERFGAAVRRAMPELRKIERYERRAATQRAEAMSELIGLRIK